MTYYLGRLEPTANHSTGPDGPPVAPSWRTHADADMRSVGHGITRKATGQELKDVAGVQEAEEVRDRLLAIKPKGGAPRVAPNGCAAVYMGGHWIYAGRIDAAHWFPGTSVPIRATAASISHRDSLRRKDVTKGAQPAPLSGGWFALWRTLRRKVIRRGGCLSRYRHLRRRPGETGTD